MARDGRVHLASLQRCGPLACAPPQPGRHLCAAAAAAAVATSLDALGVRQVGREAAAAMAMIRLLADGPCREGRNAAICRRPTCKATRPYACVAAALLYGCCTAVLHRWRLGLTTAAGARGGSCANGPAAWAPQLPRTEAGSWRPCGRWRDRHLAHRQPGSQCWPQRRRQPLGAVAEREVRALAVFVARRHSGVLPLTRQQTSQTTAAAAAAGAAAAGV